MDAFALEDFARVEDAFGIDRDHMEAEELAAVFAHRAHLADHAAVYPGQIANVQMLGADEKLTWTRDADGLTINLPAQRPCDYAYVFKITPQK